MEAAIVLVPTSCLSQLHVCLDCKITFLKYRSQHLHRQFTHPVRDATPLLIYPLLVSSCFNSRTPCGVRQLSIRLSYVLLSFQFTHPVRGATQHSSYGIYRIASFNSRTPCGVRLDGLAVGVCVKLVSIHAPRAGCDQKKLATLQSSIKFQFTHPVRGATTRQVTLNGQRVWFQFTHPVRGATTDGADYR